LPHPWKRKSGLNKDVSKERVKSKRKINKTYGKIIICGKNICSAKEMTKEER
jgi:hypothetical protein